MTSPSSEGVEHYDVLPLPSPGLEEIETVPGGALSDLGKPLIQNFNSMAMVELK